MAKTQKPGCPAQAVMHWDLYRRQIVVNREIIKMPILVKSMRDIWDEERRAFKKQQESAVFSKSRKAFGSQAEEGLAKSKKYFLEHVELKKVVIDFFPDYQRYLGEAGFTKI